MKKTNDYANVDNDIESKSEVVKLTLMQMYKQKIAESIQNNWAFPYNLLGNTQNIETQILIRIMSDGTISNIWFKKRSNNDLLDDSAYKAIQKTYSLPPIPNGTLFYDVVLVFTPSGIK